MPLLFSRDAPNRGLPVCGRRGNPGNAARCRGRGCLRGCRGNAVVGRRLGYVLVGADGAADGGGGVGRGNCSRMLGCYGNAMRCVTGNIYIYMYMY